MTDVAKGQLVLHGFHVRQGADGQITEPISYAVDWPAITAGNSVPKTITIDSDWNFVWTSTTHTQADTAAFIPLRVTMQDSDGRNAFRNNVYLNCVSSNNAGQPFILPKSRMYSGKTQLSLTFSVDA